MYDSEASYCVLLNLVNAFEVSDKQEWLSREMSFLEVSCDSRVP